MSLKNAKSLPEVYYGLHFEPGVAEYRPPGEEPYRVLINERTAKEMDPTFPGKPVYVRHVKGIDLENLEKEADGYVADSFYNKSDGKHWVKFIVISDRGHEAIKNGWRLSNAYFPREYASGGQWHGVEYEKEIMKGEYEHLAIVPDPRYENSVIYTPEQFKIYNRDKEVELSRLANSKEDQKGDRPMFSFLKKSKVENATDFETMSVILPKSGREIPLVQIINEADDLILKKDEPQMANGDHKVKVGDEEMTVNELVEKHLAIKDALNKSPSDSKDEKKDESSKDVSKDDSKQNTDKDEKPKDEAPQDKPQDKKEEKKENEKEAQDQGAKKKEEEDQIKNSFFDELYGAPEAMRVEAKPVDTSADKTARGQDRYGSQK